MTRVQRIDVVAWACLRARRVVNESPREPEPPIDLPGWS